TSAYAGGAFTAGPTFNPRGFIGSITFEPALPCSGTPTAGTATASARTCFNDDVVLSLTGSTLAAGLTYQWESSPAGAGTFSSISGATSLSHTISNPAVSTDYRCVGSCGTNSTTSTIVSVASMSPPTTFYESFDTTSTGT